MQTAYHIEETIETIFDQIETGQESAIVGNSPFSDCQLSNMGITQILEMQEYTHGYRMWKRISSNEITWVSFKSHFQEAYLDQEKLEQTAEAAGYGSANNSK